MGIGARGDRAEGPKGVLGLWGDPHVNLAGQEMLEWLEVVLPHEEGSLWHVVASEERKQVRVVPDSSAGAAGW